LESEIAVVKPQAIMLLGATAAQALFGSGFRVTVMRGRVLESRFAPIVMATIHPSAILRAPDEDTRRKEYRDFVDDLKKLATAVSRSPERV
jgi:DNA polymerase